ncbi:MAG: hypothetical protein KKI08_01075 [Armatimonadetes bacterium]|nr:hypothetical protein [Armatimonadota bacterium]
MDPTRLAQLKDYVKQSRDAGQTYDQVRAAILGGGWTDDEVNEYLPLAWAETEPVMAAPPAAPPPVVAPATPVVAPTYAAPAAPAYAPASDGNTSGQPGVPVPPEVEQMGWCWGGFGLNWIWGIGNRVFLAFLVFIPVPLASLAVQIWLGVAGHKMAWQNRRFDSMQQYKDTMKAWNLWGLIAFIASLLLAIAYVIVVVLVGVAAQSSGTS